jgi:hypothetical protein
MDRPSGEALNEIVGTEMLEENCLR